MLALAQPASAAVVGPVYPVPGFAGSGHGGNTCSSATDQDGAMGKGAGQTWSFGGGGATPAGPGCDPGPPVTTPFDTSRFEALYWGSDSSTAAEQPQIALDGVIDAPGETLSVDLALSDLAGGKVVWTGATTMHWCDPGNCPSFTTSAVSTRFTLLIKDAGGDPVPLVDPASVNGLAAPAQVGGVVSVTPALTNFSATMLFEADDPATTPVVFSPALDMFNAKNHPDPPPNEFNTRMSFSGAFWYDNRAPVSNFTFPAPQSGQPVTFTSTATDPDGTIAARAWDLDNDGAFDDGTGTTAQRTYGVGTHTVRLRVTDDDGETATVAKTFTISPQEPPVDTTAPIASLDVPAQKLKPALKNGIAASLTSNEAAGSTLELTLPKGKKLKLPGVVGTASPSLGAAGTEPFVVELTKKAKKKLKKKKKVKFVLEGPVTDLAGNDTSVSKTFTLKK